jgi:diguanylate cyclase (GGDEF)-like protein
LGDPPKSPQFLVITTDSRDMGGLPSARETALAARVETARAGIALILVAAVGLLAYIGLTWSDAHRGGLVLVALFGCATALVPWLAGLERVLDERWAAVTWLAWSLSIVAANAVGVALDGGAHSPLIVIFALPLMFSALSYPRRIALVVCTADLLACLGALLVSSHGGAGFTGLVLWVLAGAAGLCIWQVSRQERQESRLAELSRTDSLTGVLNRRAFVERLQGSVAEYERHQTPFGLLVLDLNEFKLVNDRLGHLAGDEVLQWTARVAAETLRPTDALARLGGDEFAVLLGDVSREEIALVHGRLIKALAERAPATVGHASCPEDGADGDVLYRLADARLYDAKRASGQLAA